MNAKQFITKMQNMAAKDDAFDIGSLSTTNPRFAVSGVSNANCGSAGCVGNTWTDNTTGSPWWGGGTYNGDPIPSIGSPSPSNIPYVPYNPPPQIFTVSGTNSLQSSSTDLFMEFFNVQRLQVEATCAVTGEKIKAGEIVLILDEHIISKKAFMKMLMKQFARMMTPEIEDIAECYDYDK